MYEQFFHFKQRPFLATPYTRNYVPTEMAETAREQLLRTVLRGEGPGLLIGPPGTGKTLLLQVLREQCRSDFDVIFLTHGRFPTARALLQTLLHDLKQPFQGLDEAELRISLLDYLNDPVNRPVVVFADEADTLKFRILEELRILTNVQRTTEPALRLVLAGSPSLEERLTAPRLQTLNQRIVVRCYLDALNRADTFKYIRDQITRAGGKADQLFPESALQAVYHATGGVPRLINQICDHALVLAYADGIQEITAELVQEAWSDLQQIPIPWGPPPSSPANRQGIIEIGSLEDEPPEASCPKDMTLEQDSFSGGGTRFGFSEKPGSEPLISPHIAEPSFSSDDDQSLGEGMGEFDGVAPDYPTVSASSPAASEAERIAIEDRADPLKQIDRIEQAIHSLQDESAHSPPTKPQAELVFYDWGDPFEETFLQEIPVRPSKKTGQPLELEDEGTDNIAGMEQQPPMIRNPDHQGVCPMSLPEGKDQNSGLTCQVNEDLRLDAHTPNGQLMQSLSDHESNMVDSSPTSHNRRDVRPDLIEEEPETSYNLANPIPDAEQYESGPQHESDAKDGHETQFGATLRFPSHADEASMNSDKSNKHRAIMKSLFTRLRKSG
jgi:type II secretory pathway predicted ATPase ExeA